MTVATRARWIVGTVLLASLLALLLPCLLPSDASAQVGYRGWGPRGGLSIDPDQVVFGAHIDFGELTDYLRFRPSMDLGLGDNLTLVTINPDLAFFFPVRDVGSFFVGGLLKFEWWNYDNDRDRFPYDDRDDDSDADLGIHLITGLDFAQPRNTSGFLFEIQLGLDDAPDGRILVGYTFR